MRRANKINASIPDKNGCFYKMKTLERRNVLYFWLRLLSRTFVLHKVFTRDISRIVKDRVKFYPWCFSLGILLQKSYSWFPSCTVKYISQECHNFNYSYLHMQSKHGLFFKILSKVVKLYLNYIWLKLFIHQSFEIKTF